MSGETKHLDWMTIVELHEGLIPDEEGVAMWEHLEFCEHCQSLQARLDEVAAGPAGVTAPLLDAPEALPAAPSRLKELGNQLLGQFLDGTLEETLRFQRIEEEPPGVSYTPAYQKLVKAGARVLEFMANPLSFIRSRATTPDVMLEQQKRTLSFVERLQQRGGFFGNSLIVAQVKFDLFSSIAKVLDVLQRYQEALDIRLNAVHLSRQLGLRHEEGVMLRLVGVGYFRLGEFSRALSNFERALRIARSLNDDFEAHENICSIGGVQGRLGNPKAAVDAFAEAIELARGRSLMSNLTIDLNNLAIYYRVLGEYHKALEASNQALALQRDTGDRANEALTLIAMGNTYSEMGDHEEAVAVSQEALTVFQQNRDFRHQSICLLNISNSLNELGRYVEALAYCNASLEIKQQLNDSAGIISALNEKGRSLRELDRHAEALDVHREAHGRATRQESGELLALAKHQLAETLLVDGKSNAALEYAEAAFTLARELTLHRIALETAVLLARIYASREDEQSIRRIHEEGRSICDHFSYRAREERLLHQLPGFQLFATEYTRFREQLQVSFVEGKGDSYA